MGKSLSKLGNTQRQKQLANWKDGTYANGTFRLMKSEASAFEEKMQY